MPDNNTGQDILDLISVLEDTGYLYLDHSPSLTSISDLPNQTLMMEEPINNHYNEYIEWDIDNIHSKLLKDWGIDYLQKPVTKLIKNDEDMSNEISNDKNMKLLEKEEIEKAVCKINPNEFYLNKLLDNQSPYCLPIGRIGTGNLERLQGKSNYWIILGHRINGKLSTSNKETSDLLNSGIPLKTKEYIVYNLNSKKLHVFNSKIISGYFNSLSASSIVNSLNKFFKYKIISSTLSGKVFGLGKSKANLVNTIVEDIRLEFGNSVRLGQDTWYAIINDNNTGKNVKFCLCDLEIILPNIKGYNFPKDKTIVSGDFVFIKKDNVKTVYKVGDIYPNISSKRLMKNSTTRKLDVLLLVNRNNASDSKKVYAKNVKKIEE